MPKQKQHPCSGSGFSVLVRFLRVRGEVGIKSSKTQNNKIIETYSENLWRPIRLDLVFEFQTNLPRRIGGVLGVASV